MQYSNTTNEPQSIIEAFVQKTNNETPSLNVDALKAKYGAVYLIEVDNPDGDPHQFYLKKPDRIIMGAVAKLGSSDPFRAASTLIENCLLAGDKKLLEDMSIFSAVSEQFETVNQARKATIKNL